MRSLQWLVAAMIAITTCAAADEALQQWQIKDFLGRAWTNELVFFPVKASGAAPGQEQGFSVVDNEGRTLPFQFRRDDLSEKAGISVAIQVDLAPNQSRRFTLVRSKDGRAATRGDVRVEARDGDHLMSAGRIAVKVALAEGFKPGTAFRLLPPPVLAVRGVSGRWLGEGRLIGDQPVRAFTTTIEADGPLFAQVKVRYEFDDRKFYQMRVRVISGEDVALVEEDFALSADELESARLVPTLDIAPEIGMPMKLAEWIEHWSTDWMVAESNYQSPKGGFAGSTDERIKAVAIETDIDRYPCFAFNFCAKWQPACARTYTYKTDGSKPYYQFDDDRKIKPDMSSGSRKNEWKRGLVLTPCYARDSRASAVGFDGAQGPGQDYLGIFSRYQGRWRHPTENRVPLPWLRDGVTGFFLAFEGRREWGLFVDEAGPQNVDRREGNRTLYAAIRRAQVRHGQTPLDKVKDWVLEWPLPDQAFFPCLYYSAESVARMKQAYPRLSPEARAIVDANAGARALLLADAEAASNLFTFARDRGPRSGGEAEKLRELTECFLDGGQDTSRTLTHHFQVGVKMFLPQIDIALGCGVASPTERRSALATAAFLAYKQADPDYWPAHAHGGGAVNPNKITIPATALAMLAAVCQGHPERENWLRLCERIVCADILASIGPRGEWVESPGYQGAGMMPMFQTVLILRNAGIVDLLEKEPFGQRLMSASTCFANLLGPKDPREDPGNMLKGRRMPMALGHNTPFAINAYVYLAAAGAKRFPVEAGNAMWCWDQMGRPCTRQGPDANEGAMQLLLFNEGILNGAVKPVPISGKSEIFPGFGIMHRHGFDTPVETFMTFRQNDWGYSHWKWDQGSFSLFAKGAPLCIDWVDYGFDAPDMRNRVDYRPEVEPWLVKPPEAVILKPEADYVRARHAGAPPDKTGMHMDVDARTEWQRQYILIKDNKDPGDATYLVFRDAVTTGRPSTWNCWTLAKADSQAFDGNTAKVRGQFGVDVVFSFFRKPPGALNGAFQQHKTGSYINMMQDMVRVQAGSPADGDYGVVLYPVRRGIDTAPAVKELPGGTVELAWPGGRRHLVFLFPETREVEEAGYRFKGRAGLVKQDGKAVSLVPLECETLAPQPSSP